MESREPQASVSAEPRAPAATATLPAAIYDDDETLVNNRLCDASSPVLARDDWPALGELSAPPSSAEPARPASPVTNSDDATWSSFARRGKPKGQ